MNLLAALASGALLYLCLRPSAHLRRLRSRRSSTTRSARASLLTALSILAVFAVVGVPWGIPFGLVAYLAVPRLLDRLEPAVVRRRRSRIAADLPLAVDLLAACIRTGRPPNSSLVLVGSAIGGPLGELLGKVAHQFMLGADPVDAWSPLDAEQACQPFARAVRRSLESGAPPVRVLERLADDTRQTRRHEADRRARSVESRAALPLGLCFLPAFVVLTVPPTLATTLLPLLPH